MSTIWRCTGLRSTRTETVPSTQVRRVASLIYMHSGFLTLSTSSQRSKRKLVSRLGHRSGAFQVPSGSVGALSWTLFKKQVLFSFCLYRSELSVEKTSVLQSELESCNQLQEMEPLNKCKVRMCVCVWPGPVRLCSSLLLLPRQGVYWRLYSWWGR